MGDTKPREYSGLENVVVYADGLYVGGAPEPGAGFDTLSGLGIRTIISVDGAIPDVDDANSRGIRYIHLPIGYNGFDEARKLELVRATRDALKDGPVYLHCHHGKHRAAGAAGTVVVSLGLASPEAMVERMRVSGTAPNYKGLYACTANATVLSSHVIDSVPARFSPISRPEGFVQSMVEIDSIYDLLKEVEAAGWKAPKDHPDLVPVAEAGRLADLLRVLDSDRRVRSEPATFGAILKTNHERAKALEDMLARGDADAAALTAQFRLVGASCKDCHSAYRD